MAETIKEKDAVTQYEQDVTLYSIIVNRRRAIPMVHDGLKPIQRKILYGAYKHGLTSPTRNEKSATLVGYIIGNLSCHGDTSAYGSIVNLAQWFSTKYPLMEPIGSYGAVDGSEAAAMRYTHAAMSNFGYDVMIDELMQSNNIVDWIETFTRTGLMEPEYLPAKLPLLLINGSFGIGLGIQVKVPSHNLSEVVAATRQLLKNPKSDIVLIPDFCQACDIIDADWKSISNTGAGTIKIRGKIITEQDRKGNIILHIISTPDMVNTTSIYEKIIELIDKKELPMIKDIYDGLDKNERPDIIIHLRPGVDPEYVKQILYARTELQQTYAINFQAVDVDGINIKRYSYKEYLLTFIEQRLNTKFRLYCNKLQQCMTRHHQIDAFIKVLESNELDNIIAMIRKQKSTDEVPIIEYIIKHCHTTDVQAKFIINTNLSRLTLAHLNNYREERERLNKLIAEYMPKVTDDGTLLKKEIDNELVELEKKYRTPRLCNVITVDQEQNIPAGIFKVVVTEKNFLRKVPDTDKVGIVRKDNPKFIIRIDNRENLLLFDNKGKVFILPVSKIPISDKSSSGIDVRILVKNLTANIVNIFSETIFRQISTCGNKHYLVVATKNNLIKKLDIEDFLNVTPSGLVYTKLGSTEDEVIGLTIVAHNLDLIIGSKHKALRINMKDIPLLKRAALGAKIMDTDDFISGMGVLYPDVTDIIVITRNGKANRFSSAMMQVHRRGSKGNIIIKLDPSDEIIAVLGANENDSIQITTPESIEMIPVNSIKVKSSIAPGTKIINSPIIKADIRKM